MGKKFNLRGILRRTSHDSPAASRAAPSDAGLVVIGPSPPKSVDDELVIQAARLVVTTRLASKTLLTRHLYLTDDVADQLLGRLEHCKVIAPVEPGRRWRVVTRPGELPGVIAEFERRG